MSVRQKDANAYAAVAQLDGAVSEVEQRRLEQKGEVYRRLANWTLDALGLASGPAEVTRLTPIDPAAVEVAAYRIAQAALANVARHARAQTCSIRLWLNGALYLEVRDDGRGLPPSPQAGVGLVSMRERAAELGGTCVVDSVPGGGTSVLARLPIPDDPSEVSKTPA